MKFKDNANEALIKVLGLGNEKNITAVNIRMRPGRLPTVTVQYVHLGEYGSNKEPGTETKRFSLVNIEGQEQ
jgi:hypothetical protein